MNFEDELLNLILQRSPEVDNLRLQAINGNTNSLRTFCNVFRQLLTNENTHPQAYEQINKMLISANPDIANHLNNHVLPTLASNHCRKDLNPYIVFWSEIMQGSAPRLAYPNIKNTLKNAKVNLGNKVLSEEFAHFLQIFEKNVEIFRNEKVEFFQDFDQSSFATDTLDEQNAQQIIRMDIQQLKQIRSILEKGGTKPTTIQQYLKKAKNFVNIKPASISKQLMPQFQKQYEWAQQFIKSHQSYLPSQVPYAVDQVSDQPKINKALPSITESNHSIHLGQEVQEALFEECKEKKLMSKRLSLAGEPSKFQKTNQVLEAPLNDLFKQQQFSIPQPNFIQNPSQIQLSNSKFNQFGMQRSRPKIFTGNNSRISQEYDEPPEHELKAIKYSNKPTQNDVNIQNKFQTFNQQSVTYKFTQANNPTQTNPNPYPQPKDPYKTYAIKTPLNNKNNLAYSASPNTAFQSKTLYSTSKKKLSDFKMEKMLRKEALHEEEISQIQSYLYAPYFQHFHDVGGFCRFRRNCLEDNFVLYSSALLLVSGFVEKLTDSKIKVQIAFVNKSHSNLSLNTLYRIPKCIKIQKLCQINKRWVLKNEYTHKFAMQLFEFPLQPCIFNLKYALESDFKDLKTEQSLVFSIPVTIRNFINYLMIGAQEWTEKWVSWANLGYFRKVRNVVLDGLVIREDQLEATLSDFTVLSPIQGYSVKQFGVLCSQPNYNHLCFLLRISQRLQNIITFQLLADRPMINDSSAQYLQYCLNIWSMLLAKI